MQLERGIALVQVLIIALILNILGIYILQSTRDQVTTVRTIKSAMDLRIKLETAEAKIINALLSEYKIQNKQSENPLVRKWNFYNAPFQLEDINVQIQDLNGLISLNVTDKILLNKVLEKLEVDRTNRAEFIDSLTDWKDENDLKQLNGAERDFYESQGKPGPRNGFLQSIAEVGYIKKSEIISRIQWSKYFTVEYTGGFNPIHSPSIVLSAFLQDDSKVAKLIELRNNEQLNENSFYAVTGISGGEFISFLPGNTLDVKLTASTAEQKLTKKFTIKLRARSITRPVVITNVMWNIDEN
ncbi:type II secretion system protein GspK [Pseudoalteromonas tunicata]|uniref:type II secretion system protein GspK n=1 Tax=Pseudoalteromonas tunicata TaxID=314281 RepID=UPI00273D5EDB|nr:type II secretion system protein GspK [Pseudoalteromonas tunicata]MDP4985453.1 general secretion pathway protein GspK [Pseudoalteromonas tunicata]MDP5213571.1 type II secretion system protein GspK [Pseudoalteromonas tunicata]